MRLFFRLREAFETLPIEENFSFASHTTIGCGGSAQVALSPRTAEEAAAVLDWLRRERIPHCFLGAGANVLPADGLYEGAVVRFHLLRELRRDGVFLTAEAGVTGGRMCRFAREAGLGGAEPFTGIPTSVGGACAMNAGVPARHLGDLVHSVVGVQEGKLRTFSQKECGFSTKNSIFLQEKIAVLAVRLRLFESPQEEIARNL